jgi:hypothetical protein
MPPFYPIHAPFTPSKTEMRTLTTLFDDGVFSYRILDDFDDFVRKASMNQTTLNQRFAFEALDDFNHCPQLL